jgi:hypothetical protein
MNDLKLPNKAEKAASNIRFNIQALRAVMSELSTNSEALYGFALDLTNANHIPRGYDIEDIGTTGLQVVYDPTDGESYHCIVCRGLDISDSVSSDIEEQAMAIACEAYLAKHDPAQRKAERDEHELDLIRGK